MVYGRRTGRPLTPKRKSSLAQGFDDFSISLASADHIDPTSFFPHSPQKIGFEIGFGYGEHLLMQCQTHPDWGFIGCEPYLNALASFYNLAHEHKSNNVRTYPADALELMGKLAPASLDALFILFPDPWPKKRHHKRRIIQKNTLSLFAKLLKPSGRFLLATDHPCYFEWMKEHVNASQDFTWLNPNDPHTPPEEWVLTRYQKKAQIEGRPANFIKLIKK